MTVSELETAISDGKVCIIQIQAYSDDPDHDYSTGDEEGHYVVPTSMQDGTVFFMDPSVPGDARAFLTVADLAERWHGDEAGANRPGVAVILSGRPERPDAAPKRAVPLD